MKNIPYGKQTIDQDDINTVIAVLTKNTYLTTGPLIQQFENDIATYSNSKYAVAVSNGTAALHCAVNALGITKDDEVIVPAISFVASSNCVLYEGGTPVFVDIDPNTMNINPDEIEKLITKKTKAIMVVHFTGQLCEMKKIKKIADKYNLKIIEDAAHAIGTKDVGKYGDLSTFSFHPVKNMTTGEGGMVITNNEKYYKKLLSFRNHGITSYQERKSHSYDMSSLGYNYRLTDIQCALGISQLKKLPSFITRRKQIANMYDESFKLYPHLLQPLTQTHDNSYHIYIIKLNEKFDRDYVFNKLREKKIGVNVHYLPIYQHSYYKSINITANCPDADRVYKQIITLPIFPTLTNVEINYVIKNILEILQ